MDDGECVVLRRRVLKWQETLCGKEIPQLNEAALASVLADVQFIEAEIKRLDKAALDRVFDEVRLVSGRPSAMPQLAKAPQTINIILSDAVNAYLEPSIRQGSYSAVKPVRLAIILMKLSRAAAQVGGTAGVTRSERRRREAEMVSQLDRQQPGAAR